MNTICILEVRRPDGRQIFVNRTESGCDVVERSEERTVTLTLFGSDVIINLLETCITSHSDAGQALADALRKACA